MTLDVHVALSGYSEIDFDGKRVRSAIRKEAGEVRKNARRLIARKAVSNPGEYPGKMTGLMQRAIKVLMARRRGGSGGLWAAIGPVKVEGMSDFYPAILAAGVTGKPRTKGHKTQAKNGIWRIAPRKSPMPDALKAREAATRVALRDAMIDALVARK